MASASVPLATPMPWAAPTLSASACSASATLGPRMNLVDWTTSPMAASTRSRAGSIWDFGSIRGMRTERTSRKGRGRLNVAALAAAMMPAMDDAEQRRRVAAARVGRLATLDADGRPHLVPFCFVLAGDTLYSAVDRKPKRSQRLR